MLESKTGSVKELFVHESDVEQSLVYPGAVSFSEFFCDASSVHSSLVNQFAGINKREFSTLIDLHRFRAVKVPSVVGHFYILRKMPTQIPDIQGLGIPLPIVEFLTSKQILSGGLILIVGTPGNGKTTTCASLVSKRLDRFGGVCISIEDPAEMPLQGFHGKGFCVQREIDDEQGFAPAIRDAMRAYPSQTSCLMQIGEIRDAESATLALRSSIDGRVVISTMHASGVYEAVQRLISLAAKQMGVEEARSLIASGLKGVVHQTIINKVLCVKPLLTTDSVRGILTNPEIPLSNLLNEAKQQSQFMQRNIPIFK